MAFVNTAGRHVYVNLRGNPPKGLQPGSGTQWAMGYPEGVFLADLFPDPADPIAPPKVDPDADLERSFTYALDLPADYDPAGPWRPPNADLGRTLTFDRETPAPNAGAQGDHVIASRRPLSEAPKCRLEGTKTDPHYRFDVCTVGGHDLRPIYVHIPLLVNLDRPSSEVKPAAPIQAIDLRSSIDPGQAVECAGCVGDFLPLRVPEAPGHPDDPKPAARLVQLRAGQAVLVVLRLVPSAKGKPPKVRAGEAFTAIIRYTAPKLTKDDLVLPHRARVWTLDTNGARTEAGSLWPTIQDGWMQVHPVFAVADSKYSGGALALMIEIEGMGTGEDAPELDAAGFVPGKPWCHSGRVGEPFMGVCPDDIGPMVRR
jgi:hypothetical protein